VTGLVAIVVGIGLMTQLRSDTPYPALFLWMFIAGLGIGPSLSVFTIIIQNAVPFSKLGVATSNLTFFRQIGGSVGLAIAGTQFGSALKEQLPAQITPVVGQVLGAVPPDKQAEVGGFFQGLASSVNLNSQTGVGQSFGQLISTKAPADLHGFLAPFVPQFDHAFNNAMSLAIAQTFWIGVVTGVAAVVAALFMRELPLRSTNAAPAPAAAASSANAPGSSGRDALPPLPAAD
jgi:hypothetical protein